jgi:hypothetical protein
MLWLSVYVVIPILLASGDRHASWQSELDSAEPCGDGDGAAVGSVYVTGHSNGGIMAQRLVCERADRIAAIAV